MGAFAAKPHKYDCDLSPFITRRSTCRAPCQHGEHRLRTHQPVRLAGVVSLHDESGLHEEYQHPHPFPGGSAFCTAGRRLTALFASWGRRGSGPRTALHGARYCRIRGRHDGPLNPSPGAARAIRERLVSADEAGAGGAGARYRDGARLGREHGGLREAAPGWRVHRLSGGRRNERSVSVSANCGSPSRSGTAGSSV